MAGGSVAIINCTFNDNFAAEAGAIGISGGTLTVRNSTFSYNVGHRNLVSGGIGAVALFHATAEITGSTFANNYSSRSSGAIGNDNGTLILSNSTLIENRADGAGGGIENVDGGSVTLTNCTFVRNIALAGGAAIENKQGGTMTIRNTIVTQSVESENCLNSGSLTDGGYNLDDGDSCGFSTEKHSLADTNPLLGTLANYGGSTSTLPLLPDSPAIDWIPRGVNGCGKEIASDQRGIKRPQGLIHACDSGAFESQGFELLIMGGSKQSTAVNSAFRSPLSVLIFSRFEEPVDGGLIEFVGPKQGPGISPVVNSTVIAGSSSEVRVMANNKAGPYRVKANTRGVKRPVIFTLTNKPVP